MLLLQQKNKECYYNLIPLWDQKLTMSAALPLNDGACLIDVVRMLMLLAMTSLAAIPRIKYSVFQAHAHAYVLFFEEKPILTIW